MNKDNPPCEQCISLAICRHKDYLDLFDDCSIVQDHIPDHCHMHIRNEVKVKALCKILNPTRWEHRGNRVERLLGRKEIY